MIDCREIRIGRVTESRVETGPIRFSYARNKHGMPSMDGADWTGVFFRGDDAFHFGKTLLNVLRAAPSGTIHPICESVLNGLVETLLSCDEAKR